MKRVVLLSLVALLAVSTAAAAQERESYVLEAAGKWTAAHTRAVQAAGGSLSFSHEDTGIGVATSSNRGFAAQVAALAKFSAVTLDMMVQWQQPQETVTIEENAVEPNPPTDTFYPYIQWAPQAVHAPEAWAANCTGMGVRVAVLDGGVYDSHIDLVGRVDTAKSASFVPGFAFNQDVGTFWHGTHVAGIVAAKANGIGTVGIAPEATIVGVKVLHNGSGDFGWVISGILYAATPISAGGAGAQVINMSLGAAFYKNEKGAGPLVAALNKAVNYADRFGVLVVSSAGNDELDLDHSGNVISVPAQSGSGIAVSATGPMAFAYGETNFSRIASYTNYGASAINVAAPGGDFAYPTNEPCSLPRADGSLVTIPCWAFDMVMSTVRGSGASIGTYSWAAGTSMAAPAVSAVAAMIIQANPGISLGALKARLAQSADDEGKVGRDPFYGSGFVNALKACTAR
ncbi:MAG: peptidase and subtilisin kexin sedolisin [Acidobacteria bacterium]|nr:peptidase and subtilisin kexin sedolisin [Acidobacteriota bacterium]